MLKHETELLKDKGFDYRNKITALISLTNTHYSSIEVSQIMRLSHRQLVSLMKQNPRLPHPYDWKDNFSVEELKHFYHPGMHTKYDNIIEGNYTNLDLSETNKDKGEIIVSNNKDKDVIFGNENDDYLRQLLHGMNQ